MFTEVIKQYRRDHDLNQKALAQILECSQRDVSNAENGQLTFSMAIKLPQLRPSLGSVENFLLHQYPDCNLREKIFDMAIKKAGV